MTDKIQQARRAAFEEWACNHSRLDIPLHAFVGGVHVYADLGTGLAWLAFNAALNCVLIELPKPISEHNTDVNGFVNPAAEEYDGCLEDCRAAIESTNLGIKVK